MQISENQMSRLPQAGNEDILPDEEEFEFDVNPEDDELIRAKPKIISLRRLGLCLFICVMAVGGVLVTNMSRANSRPPSTFDLPGPTSSASDTPATDLSSIERELDEIMGKAQPLPGIPSPNLSLSRASFPTQIPEGIAGTIRGDARPPLESDKIAAEKALPTATPEARASIVHSIYRAVEKNSVDPGTSQIASAPHPIRPPLGTLLPVQLLGSVSSLRSSGFVRLELTRDVAGEGWSLKNHTILLGKLSGSVYDRMYVDLLGYLDPVKQRLVPLTGELQGNDGQQGLKGRRRKLSNVWSQALKQTSSAALSLAQASLSRGGQTTIIAPLSNGLDPINRELSDLQALSNRQDFVEVTAGAPGYILITQLPDDETKDDHFANASAEKHVYEGIAETELADLLESGSTAQIRAALPRLTPLMRQIAETILKR